VKMLGIDLPEGIEPEDLDDPEPPAQPEVQPQAQPVAVVAQAAQPVAPDEDAPSVESSPADNAKAVEVAVFKRWWKKRKSADPSQFNSAILTDAEKVALVEEMVEDAVGSDAFFRQSYP